MTRPLPVRSAASRGRPARWAARFGRASALVALAAILSPLAALAAGDQGLTGGQAISNTGQVGFANSIVNQYPIMQEAGAGWVRIEFRLGDCFSNWTTASTLSACQAQVGSKTALDLYDEVVSSAQSHNLRVLALVDYESWKGVQSDWTASNAENTGGSGDNAYIRSFANNAAGVLANHFKGRITAWEIWNEPNAWTSHPSPTVYQGSSYLYPSNYAWMLSRSQSAIKNADPNNIVISGGLLGHDIGGVTANVAANGTVTQVTKHGNRPEDHPSQPGGRPDQPGTAPGGATPASSPQGAAATVSCPKGSLPSGADYLCAVYDMGIRKARWKSGAYPLDQIGQHLYIDQGGATSADKIGAYLQEIRNAYVAYEGASTPKQTHVTEVGWQSTGSMTEALQASNLTTAFGKFKTTAYVGRAYWHSVQDISYAGLFFGLQTTGDEKDNYTGTHKPSFGAYQTAAAY